MAEQEGKYNNNEYINEMKINIVEDEVTIYIENGIKKHTMSIYEMGIVSRCIKQGPTLRNLFRQNITNQTCKLSANESVIRISFETIGDVSEEVYTEVQISKFLPNFKIFEHLGRKKKDELVASIWERMHNLELENKKLRQAIIQIHRNKRAGLQVMDSYWKFISDFIKESDDKENSK